MGINTQFVKWINRKTIAVLHKYLHALLQYLIGICKIFFLEVGTKPGDGVNFEVLDAIS